MRRAGILLHPTSLPGAGPCGDLGDGALRFLDWLHAAGCGLWQVLPLNPPGAGFSPYDSPGAMAAGTHLLSVHRLVRDGLLKADELGQPSRGAGLPDRVDVDRLKAWHEPLVDTAAARLAEGDPGAVEAFTQSQPWVADWALYRALLRYRGATSWAELSPALRDREPEALQRAREQFDAVIRREVAAQLLFRRQWGELRAAAAERGVAIIGDLPIFVSGGGCDVWANRSLFRGAQGEGGAWSADPVTGVPPDYFSPMGQRWGNPHYAWEAHEATRYAWWSQRFRTLFDLCDEVRVDHFRGFAAAWEIRAHSDDARTGAWAPGPGIRLFEAVRAAIGKLPLIAEDLGVITPDVEALRDGLGLPGMKILQFAWGGGADHPFRPHNWPHPRWVAYTATHDNDTCRGWYASAPAVEQHRYRVYCGRDGAEPHWDLIRLAWASVAEQAIAPLQDVLGLDSDARMNTPGTLTGNWTWRAPSLPDWAATRLRDLGDSYGRSLPA
jgi:4-alpha-glucanotransferase